MQRDFGSLKYSCTTFTTATSRASPPEAVKHGCDATTTIIVGAPQLHLNNHYNWVPRSTVASTAITNIGIETAGAPQLRLIVLGNLEHSCYLHDYL